MSFGLCVVGCGQYARTFLKAFQASGDPELRGQVDLFFASRDRESARAYSRRFAGRDFFGSYEQAAADPRVQALYICTPHHLHLEHALMAARYSKHILVEKPLARTLEEGASMVVAAMEAGVQLMVAENFRFMPGVVRARELIREGAIGGLRFIQIHEEANFKPEGWRVSHAMTGGGVFIDGGIHSVDMLIDLGGMPEEVYASRLPQALQDLEGEDGIILVARMKGGATGFINHSWALSRGPGRKWAAISGTRGRICYEPGGSAMTVETGEGRRRFRFREDRKGIGSMVREFIDSITENRTPKMSGQEGLSDLKVVLKAYESAARKVPVKVE